MKKVLFVLVLVLGLLSVSAAQEKVIDSKSLEGKSLEELYLMRNEIYARHGKPFKTFELDSYFGSQDWYKLNLDFNESMLSKAELSNITLIKQKEDELLKQNFLLEDGTKKLNFNNIINKRQFGQFSSEDIKRLCANGFLIVPAKEEQLFYIYEHNEYKGIASFVTTDAVLQLYHTFFDFTLRKLESERLSPILDTLTSEMLKASKQLYHQTMNQEIKKAALRNIAYFAVAHYFLTGDSSTFEPQVKDIIRKEIEKCENHLYRENSLIFNPDADPRLDHALDYTQFVPRGHYTRTEALRRYFMAMMWFGQNYFFAEENLNLIQSLIITHQLYNTEVGGQRLIDLWEKIYEPTVFYVGSTDDLDPYDYKFIIDSVFGENPKPEDFADESKLEKAEKIATELYEKTKIKVYMIGVPSGPQFRFMGQRYIPDSEILQRLSNWPKRPFPKGLDITAVLGSRVAKKLLLEKYKEGESWADYPDTLEQLIKQFSQLDSTAWQKNLYYSWIWCLKSLLELNQDFEYPFFMQNDVWELKSINTTLASWAELRHDAILYGQGSATECGGGEEWVPDPMKGYVEPNVAFYKRLGKLLRLTRDGLQKRGFFEQQDYFTGNMDAKLEEFTYLVSFLDTISIKELSSQPLTKKEYDEIRYFGGTLEQFTLSVIDGWAQSWYEIESDIDRNMAVIADVHTSQDNVLEEAVGNAFEIYVIVEIEGYLKLTRGAVFSYYEFPHPASDRLTDEKWQTILKQDQQPQLPVWTGEYLSNQPSHEIPKSK